MLKARYGGWKDEVLEEERKWIVEKNGQEEENRADNEGDGAVDANDKGKGKSKANDTGPEEEPDVADGEGIECQCCFAEYFFVCISLSLDVIFTLMSPNRKTWSNVPKPTSSARPASLNTHQPNSVPIRPHFSACTPPIANSLSLNPNSDVS